MRVFFLIVVVVLASAFALAGCDSSECESDADCTAVGQCKVARCMDGLCKSLPEPDCCGNLECEEDAGENPCTCEQDCRLEETADGTCSGKVELPHPRYEDRTLTAEHAEYFCRDDECVIGVSQDDVEEKQFFSTFRGTVSFETVTTISQPFVIGEGSFKIRVKVADAYERVQLPVKLTGIQVLSRGELLAEKSLSPPALLQRVGATYEDSLRLNPSLDGIEANHDLTVRVTYEFVEESRTGELNTVRSSLEGRYRDMGFVESEKAS